MPVVPAEPLVPGTVQPDLRRRFAPPKIPEDILVVGQPPRTSTGKVRRVGLAASLGF